MKKPARANSTHTYTKPPLPPPKQMESISHISIPYSTHGLNSSYVDEHAHAHTHTQKQLDTSILTALTPTPTPNLIPNSNPNPTSSIHSLLASTYSIPVNILDKLKLAEKEYLCELARERQQEISKLKRILEEGGRIFMADAEKAVVKDIDQQKKILCKCIEKYVECLCKLNFSYTPPSSHTHTPTESTIHPKLLDNLRAHIPTSIQNAIDAYIHQIKAEHKAKLLQELQEAAAKVAGEMWGCIGGGDGYKVDSGMQAAHPGGSSINAGARVDATQRSKE
ncbi:hypothetical protein EON65_47140 [archaeon]|nr:MAG: hypothetical protein EON65_47140 [archaeon]